MFSQWLFLTLHPTWSGEHKDLCSDTDGFFKNNAKGLTLNSTYRSEFHLFSLLNLEAFLSGGGRIHVWKHTINHQGFTTHQWLSHKHTQGRIYVWFFFVSSGVGFESWLIECERSKNRIMMSTCLESPWLMKGGLESY